MRLTTSRQSCLKLTQYVVIPALARHESMCRKALMGILRLQQRTVLAAIPLQRERLPMRCDRPVRLRFRRPMMRVQPIGGTMSHILLLTNSTGSSVDILPALELLNHRVHILPAEPTALLETDPHGYRLPGCPEGSGGCPLTDPVAESHRPQCAAHVDPHGGRHGCCLLGLGSG